MKLNGTPGRPNRNSVAPGLKTTGKPPTPSKAPQVRDVVELSPDKKTSWWALLGSALMLGTAAAGYATGTIQSTAIARLVGDSTLSAFEEFSQVGHFADHQNRKISAEQAYEHLFGYGNAVRFSYDDGGTDFFRRHSEVVRANDYLHHDGLGGLTAEQRQILERLATNPEARWGPQGVGALSKLLGYSSVGLQFGNATVYNLRDLERLDAVAFEQPSEELPPEVAEALRLLDEGGHLRQDFLGSLRSLDMWGGTGYRFTGGTLQGLHQGSLKSHEAIVALEVKVRNQKEIDSYRPSEAMLSQLIGAEVRPLRIVLDSTAAQLSSLQDQSELPQNEVEAALEAVEHFREKLAAYEIAIQERDYPQADSLLKEMKRIATPHAHRWWNPWNQERSDLVREPMNRLEVVHLTFDRPEAPLGWQRPSPNFDEEVLPAEVYELGPPARASQSQSTAG